MTLYEIDRQLCDLIEASIDPETGEFAPDPEAWDRLQMERDQKIENTACYIKELRLRIAGLKAEADTLQKRRKVLENREAWLMENLTRSLDGQNFETARCQIRHKRNPESIRILDEDAVMHWAQLCAPDCLRYKPPTISLSDLKAEMKKGAEIPGAELVRETRVEVK